MQALAIYHLGRSELKMHQFGERPALELPGYEIRSPLSTLSVAHGH